VISYIPRSQNSLIVYGEPCDDRELLVEEVRALDHEAFYPFEAHEEIRG
jgi:hypothetical protein